APAPPTTLIGYTDATITDLDRLTDELDRVRADGVAVDDGEYVAGLVGLSVPVFGARLRPIGVLGVCGTSGTVNRRRAHLALRRAARAMSPEVRALTAPDRGRR